MKRRREERPPLEKYSVREAQERLPLHLENPLLKAKGLLNDYDSYNYLEFY
jgi:hypothetical protein